MKRLATLFFALVLPISANANLLFDFQEVGGDVVMRSSGVLNVNNLELMTTVHGWGGTGIEENGNHDIMGGTSFGAIDISFRFHQGTDFSAWATANGPWGADNFSAIVNSGSKSFTTYIREATGPEQLPGFGAVRADIVNGLWATDQIWTFANHSFASLSMNVGTYTVADILTGESITFQIGKGNVPEASSLMMLGLSLLGFGVARLRRS